MSRFTTYAIKEISSSFLFLILLLSGILWMGQSLRYIDLLTTDNISILSYASYVSLLLPKIFLLTVPVCLFLAVLLNLNRLRNDSELIILWASGKSHREILLKPVLLVSIVVCLFVSFLSIYITPLSLNEIRHKIIDIRSSGINSSLLKEKKFISPIDTLTIFLQEREQNKIYGLLIHDLKIKNKPHTYIAQSGELLIDENKNILRLFNGNVQIFDKNENKISEIAFETYDLNLTPYNKIESNHIYADELITSKIVKNLHGRPKLDYSKYEKEQFSELHTRIINPIYIFVYSLLPLIIAKFSGRPNDGWLIPIISVSVFAFLIQIMQITLSNLLIENINLVTINYLMPLFLIISIIAFLFYENIRNLRDINVEKN